MDIVHVDFTTGEASPALEPLEIAQHCLRVNRVATALNDKMADLDSFEAIVRAAWAHGMTATEFMPVIDEAIARAREMRG